MEIGDRIRIVRESKEMSMRKFCDIIGISSGSLSMIENGQRQPSRRLLRLLAMAFDVNEEWLRTGEGEMFAPADIESGIADITAELWNRKDISEDTKLNLIEIVKIAAAMSDNEVNALISLGKKLAAAEKKNLPD